MDLGLDVQHREFLDRALRDAGTLGDGAAVLVVGSRGASYVDSWSDLDLWVLGDKERLSESQKAEYRRTSQVFVDRGDYHAHYAFHDVNDLAQRLSTWPDVMLWLLTTARIVHDPSGRAADLKERFRRYPDDVLANKLRWWYVAHREASGCLGVIGRGMPVAGALQLAKCIESLCKVCCLADGKPFPYTKWLLRAAGETRLGKVVCPAIERAVAGIGELTGETKVDSFRDLTPVRELRSLRDILPNELHELGWHDEWVDAPFEHYWVLFGGNCP